MNVATTPSRFREHTFSASDGLQLYYRDYGDATAAATPVLCLGGLTRNSKDFHKLAQRLAPERRVVALDYRGRGRSAYDPRPANYTPATYVRDVLDLLAAAGLARVVAVGTSLGGLVSMGIAVARPAALAGVVLNDIGPDLPDAALNRIGSYTGRAESFATWTEAVAEYRNRYGAAHPDIDDEKWLELAKDTFAEKGGRIVTDYDVRIVEGLKPGEEAPDLWALFGALGNIPVLAIRGALSDLLTPETFERMATVKPDLKRVTIPRCGHTPFLDEPEAVAAIDAFLAEVG